MSPLNCDNENPNVCRLIATVAENNPRPALIMPGDPPQGPISFSQLWERACRLSGGLKQAGLVQGDRVIIMVPMSIDLYVCLLAVVKMGAVAVFVDPWIPARKMAAFSGFAEPAAFIGIGKSHWLRFLEPRLRRIRITITTGRKLLGVPARFRLSGLLRTPADRSLAEVAADDPALITFTSGSSGQPRGANRTHRFLRAQHRALARAFPGQPTDIDMPMFPIFALNNLVSGIPSVVPDMDFRKVAAVNGKTILDQMKRHQVTTCTASPPLIDRVCEQVRLDGEPLKLRRLLTGGGPVSDRQLQAWTTALPATRVVIAYGSTEAEPVSHISATERLGLANTRPGYCTGTFSHQIRAKVIRICKSPSATAGHSLEALTLPAGETGELVVSGEHVCRDYYKNARATAESKLRDRARRVWHRMGDTGYIDSAGRFWLTGRVHSTIERAGELVHPQLIEQTLDNDVAGLHQVAAVGMPDRELGEAVWVVAVPQAGQTTGLREKIETALGRANAIADRIVIRPDPLPVDPRHNTKINYPELRRQLLESRSDAGQP